MLGYLRDKLHTARLKARYERLLQERLLTFAEGSTPQPVSDDSAGWMPLGNGGDAKTSLDRSDLRDKARQLVAHNPHARNVLRLLEIYVVGPGLRLDHVAPSPQRADALAGAPARKNAGRLWGEFLSANRRHFSFREFARRTWRDGECFLRFFSTGQWPPAVRFIDPERIAETTDEPGSQGILTEPGDVETPVAYLLIDPHNGQLQERIPAEQIIHARINADSNQKRGVTFFSALIDSLSRFEAWLETELTARKLQASIVLWRRVQGGPGQVAKLADALDTGALPASPGNVSGGTRSERYRAGTILTTSHGTELKFLQPDTNFDYAVPLGRTLLLGAAAAAGLPEFMLTADASNANYSSTLVAEGPAVKLFQSEQEFFAGEFNRLWQMVMTEAVSLNRLPENILEHVAPQWSFPKLITRDRPREREADVKLVEANVLSRAEIARRDNADAEQMQREIAAERKQMTG